MSEYNNIYEKFLKIPKNDLYLSDYTIENI